MTLQTRSALLQRLEAELGYPVVAYVTGDRPGLQTQVSWDQVPLFRRHLSAMTQSAEVGLVLYTRGGDTNVPWTVVSYLREHCDRLTVLIPFYAHSSGTLLTLGADNVVMTRYATISPIDPTVANQFNPQDPMNPAARLPINVEDVLAYLELAREQLGSDDVAENGEAASRTHLPEASFVRLADSVHPLALGNVKRSVNQIRQLARKLLALHPPERNEAEMSALVSALTTEFYSHQHQISRREAKAMGLPITEPSEQLENLLLAYYDELVIDLELLLPFDAPRLLRTAFPPSVPAVVPAALGPPIVQMPGLPISPPLQGQPPPAAPAQLTGTLTVHLERGYIETSHTCDAYTTRGEISYQPMAPQVQFAGGQQIMLPGGQQAVRFDVLSELWERLA
jgi:hypothetical protein